MKTSSLVYWAALLALLLSLSACDPDSFSREVELDIPDHTPLPVLNLGLSAGDTLISTLVSISKGINDGSDYALPQDAKVRLLRNGALFSNLAYNSNSGRYEAPLPTPLPGDAAEYRLEAELTGFAPVHAVQSMLPKPVIVSTEYRPDGVVNPDGGRSDEVIVEIEDPAAEENFYAVSIIEYYGFENGPGDTIFFTNQTFPSSNDPNLVDGYPLGLVTSDGAFNGRRYKLRLSAYLNDNPGGIFKIAVRVSQITRDAYYYVRSKNEYDLNLGNPFAEPVTVFNNIQGGYGIFYLSNGIEQIVR